MSGNKTARSSSYIAPRISTIAAGELLAALGPAAAGSTKVEEVKVP
jgi:hypothetical protein